MPLIPTGFPDYVYRPYPKFLTLADGSNVVAEHAEHEAQIMASQPKPKVEPKAEKKFAQVDDPKADEPDTDAHNKLHDDLKASTESLEEERKTLFNECISRGIKVHPKSGIAKLKAALA